MKKIIFFIVIIFFTSCSNHKNKEKPDHKPVITVSILPQKTFIEKIAGSDFDVQVLVPHGASPESYSLLPSQLKKISHSLVWFQIGHLGIEHSWKDKIMQINPNMKQVNLSEGLNLITGTHIHSKDHLTSSGVNPHLWLSPKEVRKMIKKIVPVIISLNPKDEKKYNKNYHIFLKEIELLDNNIENKLKKYQGRSFIVLHPSLSYFARDYHLTQYSLEKEGKRPTPQHIAKIVQIAQKENINTIFIQSEFNKEHARIFADEINGKLVEIYPLNADWGKNLLDLTNLLINNFE